MDVKDYKQEDIRGRAPHRALLVHMLYLSEENWAAGWLTDLEYTLWDWVLRWRSHSEPVSAFERASLADIEALSWLAEQADGWWRWHETSEAPTFVSINEWLEIYRERSAVESPVSSTPTSTTYLYDNEPAEVKSANGARGVLIRTLGGVMVFRIYHDNERFTDYEIRHDELSVTIDSDAIASFYRVGNDNILDHSPEVLGLKEIASRGVRR